MPFSRIRKRAPGMISTSTDLRDIIGLVIPFFIIPEDGGGGHVLIGWELPNAHFTRKRREKSRDTRPILKKRTRHF